MLKFIFAFFMTTPLFAFQIQIASHNLAMKEDFSLFQTMAEELQRKDLAPDLLLVQEVVGQTGHYLKEIFTMDGFFIQRPWDHEAVGILTPHPILYREGLTLKARAPEGFTRTAAMIEIDHPKAGIIRAVSTHLAYRQEDQKTRHQQMQEITTWMEKRQKDFPVKLIFLGGDFNATADEPLFSLLNSYNNPNSQLFTYIPAKRRIDYIFWQGEYQSDSFEENFPFPEGEINREFLSDHRTLFFKLKIKSLSAKN